MGVVTLTTDFGDQDWFVGTMKGVLLAIAPKVRVVDLTHQIAPGDIQAGAFALASAFSFFAPGTVHVAVVDPGVGSSRRPIVVETRRYLFVGPDNGVLSRALATESIQAIRLLQKDEFFRKPVSQTFHGRDIFAPVAAHLSRGVPVRQFGPKLDDYVRFPVASVEERAGEWKGVIVYIDRFGNAITNLPSNLVPLQRLERNPTVAVSVGRSRRKRTLPIVEFYEAVPPGAPLALVGSTGYLEIAVNGGSAAKQMGLAVGAPVWVRVRNDVWFGPKSGPHVEHAMPVSQSQRPRLKETATAIAAPTSPARAKHKNTENQPRLRSCSRKRRA